MNVNKELKHIQSELNSLKQNKKLKKVQRELNKVKDMQNNQYRQMHPRFIIINGYSGEYFHNYPYKPHTMRDCQLSVLNIEDNGQMCGICLTCRATWWSIENGKPDNQVVFDKQGLKDAYARLSHGPLGDIVAKQAKLGTVKLTPKLVHKIHLAVEHD